MRRAETVASSLAFMAVIRSELIRSKRGDALISNLPKSGSKKEKSPPGKSKRAHGTTWLIAVGLHLATTGLFTGRRFALLTTFGRLLVEFALLHLGDETGILHDLLETLQGAFNGLVFIKSDFDQRNSLPFVAEREPHQTRKITSRLTPFLNSRPPKWPLRVPLESIPRGVPGRDGV